MKVLHLNYLNNIGGAGIAAYRTTQYLKKIGVDAKLFTNENLYGELTRFDKFSGPFNEKIKIFLSNQLLKMEYNESQSFRSINLFPSKWPKFINKSDFDIVNLHWIGNEMISVSDISKIKKPIVWTFHDLWPINGIDHYPESDFWKSKSKSQLKKIKFDLNKFNLKRKLKFWNKTFEIVTPSKWLAREVKQSLLFSNFKVTPIMQPIDCSFWAPMVSHKAKRTLGINATTKIILFGAMSADTDTRKGFDILLKALHSLNSKNFNLQLLIFGNINESDLSLPGIDVKKLGFLSSESKLRELYCSADVFVIPSRKENLPLTAIESLSCGTPVVSFKVGGLDEVVIHKKTGYLAEADNFFDLGRGIDWVLENSSTHHLNQSARNLIIKNHDVNVTIMQYKKLYSRILKGLR